MNIYVIYEYNHIRNGDDDDHDDALQVELQLQLPQLMHSNYRDDDALLTELQLPQHFHRD